VTQLPEWAPAGLDVTRPSAARIYDYYLGGAHNFESDRQLGDQVAKMAPNVAETARANRHFLRRAVQFLAGSGIHQFLDIGSGIPTAGNVHEVAQAASPGARVVYVDIDPVAVAQSMQLLVDNYDAEALCFDLRDPPKILAEAVATGLFDPEQPAALLLAGVVHFVPDVDGPGEIIAQLRDALAPGSYLVISHATADGQPPELKEAQRLSGRTSTEITLRPHAEIAGYFGDFELVEPGLVHLGQWRPEPGEEPDPHPERLAGYAGVGRKG
jgi:SAM-dependent methyltransferase